jgi:plastocyanin
MSASITAKDPYTFDNGSAGHSVTIAKGGSVTFSYPSGGATSHNVVFDTAQPASCTDMPATPSPSPWSGSCTFDSYGTYAFHCGLHGSLMRGSVEVPDPNAPTSGTTTPPPTDTGGQQPGGGAPGAPVFKVAHRQRGVTVRGSVTTPAGPSAIAVTALVARKVLASRVRLVKVGAVEKHSAATGRTAFSLRINRAARRAFHRRHRLAVTLRIAVTPEAGTASKKTVAVVLTEKR